MHATQNTLARAQLSVDWFEDGSMHFNTAFNQTRTTQEIRIYDKNKNSSGDEIANMYFYAVRQQATRIR